MRVMVNVGDTVARDQLVLELETDKATIEVPSSVAGTVKEIKVKPGDKVKTGQVVLVVDNGGVPAASKKTQKAAAAESAPPSAADQASAPAPTAEKAGASTPTDVQDE